MSSYPPEGDISDKLHSISEDIITTVLRQREYKCGAYLVDAYSMVYNKCI